MRTRIQQHIGAACIALVFTLHAADEPKPVAVTNTNVAAPAADPPAVNPPVAPPAPAASAESVKVIQFPKPGLPPLLDQVVKLSQSGADETVVRAYVEKAAPPYRITGNEIVQLRDLGIPQGVIMSLIEHSQSADAAMTTEVVSPQTSAPQAQPAPVGNAVQAPLTAPEVTDFYDALSPYGTWLDVPGYGYSWQPSVVVVNSGWQPYCDGGYWLWSDYGWYWHSYYSWGWAPFHYGRWYCQSGYGWLWCPDRTWGSSWVCWRNSSSHCGWAPLPPGACFTGHGWTHHGNNVGVGFGFGISADHFTFVAHSEFSDRNVGSHALHGNAAATAFRNTTVLNSYAMGPNNRVVNNGIGRETIAAAARTPIREVSVRELPHGNTVAMPDRVSRSGNGEVVFRPGSQISVPRSTSLAAAPSARTAVAQRNSVPVNASAAQRSPGQFSVGANATASRAMPNYSQSTVARNNVAQATRSAPPATAYRNSAPQFQARGYNAPMASVQRSYAAPQRSYAPAQRSYSPPVSAPHYSAPAAGRSYSGGGASHGASTVARSSGGHR